MNMQTTALNELMTLRVAENTSKVFVDSLKPLTPINVDLLASLLTDHPDRVFVDGLCSGLRDGFKIGYTGSRQPYASKNLKTAYNPGQNYVDTGSRKYFSHINRTPTPPKQC